MGSSGGSTDYEQPTIPTPPNVAPYGSSVPFKPSFINFLGDPSVPSTGLTPDMLAAIDQMYQNRPTIGVPANPQQAAAAPAKPDRNKLAQMMGRGGGEGGAGRSGAGSGGNNGGWGGK
jgi:hypothetical protein